MNNSINGHEFVDLGLPSGTLWATCNIGAKTSTDVGNYFAWGETKTKEYFDDDNYKFYDDRFVIGSDEYKKYCFDDKDHEGCYDKDGNFIGDGLLRLLPEDDAATVLWGQPWHIPTKCELEELLTYCNFEYKDKPFKGYTAVSKVNGRSIFLPAGGYIGILCEYEGDLEGTGCWYWTSCIDVEMDYSWACCLRETHPWIAATLRYKGLAIRAVAKM